MRKGKHRSKRPPHPQTLSRVGARGANSIVNFNSLTAPICRGRLYEGPTFRRQARFMNLHDARLPVLVDLACLMPLTDLRLLFRRVDIPTL